MVTFIISCLVFITGYHEWNDCSKGLSWLQNLYINHFSRQSCPRLSWISRGWTFSDRLHEKILSTSIVDKPGLNILRDKPGLKILRDKPGLSILRSSPLITHGSIETSKISTGHMTLLTFYDWSIGHKN